MSDIANTGISKGAPVVRDVSKMGLKLLPFTPVPFTGTEAFYAWGRLLAYTTLGVMTWEKHRKLSYVALAAAGLSLTTSLASGAYQ
jgi:hypothetical protein